MRQRARLYALSVASVASVACIALVGCGDDGNSKIAADTPVTASAPAPLVDDRTVEQQVADFERADAALVQLSDLPAGWKVDPTDEDPAADKAFLDCIDPPNRALQDNDTALAERDYRLGDTSLFSTVEVHPGDAYAAESFGLVRHERFPECYRKTLETELLKEGDATVQIERLPDPALGDDAAALRMSVVLTGPGGQAHLVLDVLAVRVGRVEASIGTIGRDAPLDPAMVDHLLHLTVDRINTI